MNNALVGSWEAWPPHGVRTPATHDTAIPDGRRAVRAGALRLGIIASEFPPEHGGMQEHARGLAESLSRDHRVQVYVSCGPASEVRGRGLVVRPVMRWDVRHDLAHLARAKVDAWITLNAGLAPYARHLRAPVFAYVHGNDFARPWLPHPDRLIRLGRRLGGEAVVRRWRTRQIAAGLRAARWVFANSAFSRSLCARMHGVAEERISVVSPGIRREFFEIRRPQPGRGLRLVTVSRLAANARRKNVEGVLRAIARLRGEMDISYTVIGDGDDLSRLRDLAAALGLGGSVRFLGAIDTAMVIEEFSRSDAFVMAVEPSVDDVEGFGMVYAEAAATGLPSIGTNTGGIPEVVEDGVTGILLDDVSAEGIADGFRRFERRRGAFDRTTIRNRAARFSAAHCAGVLAERLATML